MARLTGGPTLMAPPSALTPIALALLPCRCSAGVLFARVLPLAFTAVGAAALVTGLYGMYTGTGKRD